MTWSYNLASLSTPLYAVRLLIGDTDTTNQQLQDEEITFFLSQYNNGLTYVDQIKTAIDCVTVMGQKAADLIREEETGDVRVQLFERSKYLESLLDRLKALLKSKQPISAFCGGISLDGIRSRNEDSDRNPNRISQRIHDNPEVPLNNNQFQDGKDW